MEKLLIDLYVCALQEHFDVLFPCTLVIQELLPVVVEAVINITEGFYIPSGQERLCRIDSEQLLSPNHTLKDYGILNGDSLLLI